MRWDSNNLEDFFKISSILRVPSYISLLSALYYYGVSSQLPQGVFESITISQTKKYNIEDKVFKYYKVKKRFFSGFIKKDGYFIAEKEKAFVDMVYLYSFGKYSFDFYAIDIGKLDKKKIRMIIRNYPKKTVNVVRRICGI